MLPFQTRHLFNSILVGFLLGTLLEFYVPSMIVLYIDYYFFCFTKKQKKKVEESQASQEKKKIPEKDTEKKDEELSVSLLKIQIGQIRKAWKHPSADR